MFIETEGTPNPATLKFLPGTAVMQAGTADFPNAASAARSPLAQSLFALPGVARVFLGGDFVTITKSEAETWQGLKPQVLGAIMEHFVAGRPVIEGEAASSDEEEIAPEDREIVDQIKELLDTRVRPAVAYAGRMQWLPEQPGDVKARHREHAAALCARSSRGRAGRALAGRRTP
jgi:hypothetical protein